MKLSKTALGAALLAFSALATAQSMRPSFPVVPAFFGLSWTKYQGWVSIPFAVISSRIGESLRVHLTAAANSLTSTFWIFAGSYM